MQVRRSRESLVLFCSFISLCLVMLFHSIAHMDSRVERTIAASGMTVAPPPRLKQPTAAAVPPILTLPPPTRERRSAAVHVQAAPTVAREQAGKDVNVDTVTNDVTKNIDENENIDKNQNSDDNENDYENDDSWEGFEKTVVLEKAPVLEDTPVRPAAGIHTKGEIV